MARQMQLEMDCEAFLAKHWQKKPLLVRSAIADFTPPVSAEELAGLAMEDDVESRIIECSDDQWFLQHGPFSAADFQRTTAWTLLVQAVDHYLPEVATLRTLFDFIPQWRFDDIMVSYAENGGGVGPHYDNYDVFLLQGEGERLWRLGQFCTPQSALLPHDELRILENFDTTEEYLLRPGDMLYVPPGVAHWGVSQGRCTTFSIGFRAPRVNDMVSRWVDQLLASMEPDEFFHDAGQAPASRPGEIRPRDLERVIAQLQAALDQEQDENSHWFGELVTEPKYEPALDDEALVEARRALADNPCTVYLDPSSRLAWQHEAGRIIVFANGDTREFEESVLTSIEALCGQRSLQSNGLAESVTVREMLDYLLQRGCIYVE